jgi:DNA-binding CsgD family transcriptional regulator
MRKRLIEVARSLELYAAPASLSDSSNRILHVNTAYARTIGDPNHDRLDAATRFIPAAMVGPYHEHFPQMETAVASCLPVIVDEVESGRLERRAQVLMYRVLESHPEVRRLVDCAPPWRGQLLMRDDRGRVREVREQVIPVADAAGQPSGFYINLWVDLGAPDEADGVRPDVMALTLRQREIAGLVVAGLSAREIARRLDLSYYTVRGHLEEIHARLDVHSRAELTALLVREGVA